MRCFKIIQGDGCRLRTSGLVALSVATVLVVLLAVNPASANLSPSSSSQVDTLTGLLEFGTSSNGTYVTSMWNTVGGDQNFNLYISQTGNAGSFINSGNGASTSISAPLSPGTYNFSMFGEGGASSVSYFGLNLFFDGGSTAPSISVFAPFQTSTTAPPFLADGQSTPFLGPYNGGTLTLENGAGTTSFVDGPDVISLTSYAWANQSVYELDRVNGYGSTSNGVKDFVGEFTLVVTPVPEPTSFLLFAAAIGLYACIHRRRTPGERVSNDGKSRVDLF